MSLENKIKKVAKAFEGKLGVAVKHLGTGEEAFVNGNDLFPTASVFKVPVIVELYRQVESGRIRLNRKITLKEYDKVPGSGVLRELNPGLMITVQDLATLMIIISDNTATDIIFNLVGKENINKTLRKLGLEKTKVVANCRDLLFGLYGLDDINPEERTIELFRRRTRSRSFNPNSWTLRVENNNVTTPREMLRLLEMIESGEAASQASCNAIIETMKKCQTDNCRIPKYLPRNKVEMARKTGNLPGIRPDVGIIYLLDKGECYILCCFTMDAADDYAAEEAIAAVSKLVYDHFTA